MMEERLDKILVQRNLVDSRVKAEQIIQEIGVKVNGKLITKTGKKFPLDCEIELVPEKLTWSSVEALKLVQSITHWDLPIKDGFFLDVSSVNGVFTEVLLEQGAKKVGYVNNLKDSFSLKDKDDKRIIDYTGLHLRELTKNNLTDLLNGCVIDENTLSFNKIFPFIHPFLSSGAFVVAVIKPQLEVGKEHLKNNGSVRNTLAYADMFESIKAIGKESNLNYVDHIDSPIVGKDGQHEFLVLFRRV